MSLPGRFASRVLAGILGLLGLGSLREAQQVASFAPDDPRILYSDDACRHVDGERASFHRQLTKVWVCNQEEMSPGVRATFLVDASHIRFELDYRFAGFTCGVGLPMPLSWEFGLIVDGVRKPTGSRNPLYPWSAGSTQWVSLGNSPGLSRVTLVWPAGADVDLRRIHLRESRDSSVPELLALPVPPVRPLVVAFGESTTQGLSASHVLNAYPSRLAILRDWRMVNLGFAGRPTEPTDARLAAGWSECRSGSWEPPTMLLLAIGSNDFRGYGGAFTPLPTFESRFEDWIEEFRALLPDVPILYLTPLPRGDERVVKSRDIEDYRERMRQVLLRRSDPRIFLFEGRDLIAQPPVAGDPLYDAGQLHPTDLGFEQMTERLNRFNLVRNASFELRPLQLGLSVSEPEPYLWSPGGEGTSEVRDGADAIQSLWLSPLSERTQDVLGLSSGDTFTLKAVGQVTNGATPGLVSLEFLDAHGEEAAPALVLSFTQTAWRRSVRTSVVPPGTARARLRLSKPTGPGQFLVDDLELTVPEF